MDSARFVRVLLVEAVGSDVRMVADLEIGEVKCQAVLLIPYNDPVKAKTVSAFMARAVRLEQEPKMRTWGGMLRVLKGGKSGA